MEIRNLKVAKVLSGFYQASNGTEYSNIHRGFRYTDELVSKWYADIRYKDGTVKRYAGIWDTFREALDEVEFILASPEDRVAYLQSF